MLINVTGDGFSNCNHIEVQKMSFDKKKIHLEYFELK